MRHIVVKRTVPCTKGVCTDFLGLEEPQLGLRGLLEVRQSSGLRGLCISNLSPGPLARAIYKRNEWAASGSMNGPRNNNCLAQLKMRKNG